MILYHKLINKKNKLINNQKNLKNFKNNKQNKLKKQFN